MKVTIKFILYSYIPLISIVVNNGFAATVMECCDKYIHGHKGITSTHTACLLQSVPPAGTSGLRRLCPVLGCDGDGDRLKTFVWGPNIPEERGTLPPTQNLDGGVLHAS